MMKPGPIVGPVGKVSGQTGFPDDGAPRTEKHFTSSSPVRAPAIGVDAPPLTTRSLAAHLALARGGPVLFLGQGDGQAFDDFFLDRPFAQRWAPAAQKAKNFTNIAPRREFAAKRQ